jgi:phosphoglycerate dehydrogenase-like enzyme
MGCLVEPMVAMRVLLPSTWRSLWSESGDSRMLQPTFFDPVTSHVEGDIFEDTEGLACEKEEHLRFSAVCPGLKVITYTGTGIDDLLDHPDIKYRNVALCNVRDYASRDVAEHALALILALIKRVVVGDARLRLGLWANEHPWGLSLAGNTIGIVGLGGVGRQMVLLCRALDLDVVYYSRTRDLEFEQQHAVRFLELDDLLALSNIVSIHLPANNLTREFIGREEFERMMIGSFFVNTSRASLVDQEALLGMLSNGHLAGAALDVFDAEPLPIGHVFTNMPNVVISPHVAASTPKSIWKARLECLRNLEAFARGNPRNVVTKVGLWE